MREQVIESTVAYLRGNIERLKMEVNIILEAPEDTCNPMRLLETKLGMLAEYEAKRDSLSQFQE